MREFSDQYLDILCGELATLNLTRISTPDEFYNKQILDSVKPIQEIEFLKEIYNNSELLIDVGFGGGFPLLPLAKILPEKKLLGFEARRKKADAVNLIAERLGLDNVIAYHHRIETLHINKECVVSFKAVGKIKDFLAKLFSSSEIYVVFYKGPNVHDLENVPEKFLGYELVYECSYSIDSTEGRNIIVYKGKNVPRGTQKNLVKVSSL